jgi:hypothetical protein
MEGVRGGQQRRDAVRRRDPPHRPRQSAHAIVRRERRIRGRMDITHVLCSRLTTLHPVHTQPWSNPAIYGCAEHVRPSRLPRD